MAQPEIPQSPDPCFDIVDSVVQGKRSADSAPDSEAAEDRLSAVMPGSNRDSIAVQIIADLLGAEAIHDKRNDSGLFPRGANDPEARDLLQCFGGVHEKSMFVTGDVLQPHAIDVINSGAKPHRIGDVPGDGFKSLRSGLIDGLFEGDVLDHVAASLPGRHVLEDFGLRIDDADARRG